MKNFQLLLITALFVNLLTTSTWAQSSHYKMSCTSEDDNAIEIHASRYAIGSSMVSLSGLTIMQDDQVLNRFDSVANDDDFESSKFYKFKFDNDDSHSPTIYTLLLSKEIDDNTVTFSLRLEDAHTGNFTVKGFCDLKLIGRSGPPGGRPRSF